MLNMCIVENEILYIHNPNPARIDYDLRNICEKWIQKMIKTQLPNCVAYCQKHCLQYVT